MPRSCIPARMTSSPSEPDIAHPESSDAAGFRSVDERFRALVSSVKDYAIFMLDPSGRIETWNAGAERTKGYTADEIIGEHISRFYTPEDLARGLPAKLLAQARLDGRVESEGWRVRKDGTRFWADVVITALVNDRGELMGYAKVTRDLTERLRAQEEQLRLAHAEEAVRLRDEFLSIAAHELRTPLSAVQLQLQALLERPEGLDPRTRAKVERACRSGERLVTLVDTLLDVSRITTGSFNLVLSRFDITVAVQEVVDRFREHAIRAGSSVTVRSEGVLEGRWDRLRIEQVATNLLTNALKYAAGTPVEITLTGTEHDVTMMVSDAGPGIPPSEQERIFLRFERAAPMRNFGGLGLGLYVARQIVEAHGGQIQLAHPVPKGAHFVIRLPRSHSPETAG
ncbi:MAG TPA: PAS domain-containing sensor histidine kinase [Myxococcaceae bacterium]|nr:PAS domain-containing sensor histidine kinase [Myxococcaceae bacterium]